MLLQISEPNQQKPETSSIAIGIDLGTTNSVAAIYEDGKARVLVDDIGPIFIPSIAHGLRSTKRMMHQPTAIISGENTALTAARDILKTLKTRAENALGVEVNQAVITVPAQFDDTARQATKDAATLAGFEVLRLINEPTAAALAYGLDKGSEGIFVVYDFGGGTFDISVLSMRCGVFQVLATGGNAQLGGDDIDAAIDRHFGWDDLLKARHAKENQELDDELLTKICQPFVKQTISVCEQTLAGISKIDGVILVGGSTRLKAVRSAVKDFFGMEPLTKLDPDCVVAYGAALQAYQLTNVTNTLLLDVIPISLGIETIGGIVEVIIPRNSPIPIKIAQDFTTYENDQTAMSIHVVQGEREFVSDCRSLAKFTLNGIPPMLSGAARIRVTFSVDVDGLLTVSALEQTTNINQKIEVKPSYGLTAEDYELMLKQAYEHGHEDINQRLLVSAIIKAEQLAEQLNNAIKLDSELLDEDYLFALKDCIRGVNDAVKIKDRDLIQQASDQLASLAQPLAEKRITNAIRQKLQNKNISKES